MLQNMFTTWWTMTSAYFSAPSALLGGRIDIMSILPVVGMLLVVIGVIVAVLRREKQTRWLVFPAIAAAISPFVVSYVYDMMGWFGVLFFLVLGGIGMLGWVGVISSDARQRLPVWLVGFGLMSYVLFCGLYSIAAIWGLG
jgi:CHASE2 domain-containing sensor protein